MRLKLHTLFGDFGEFIEAENLIPATVSENGVRPVHELMQSSQRLDQLVTRPEIEVVSVAQYDLCAERFYVIRGQCFDRGLSAYRHEAGRVDFSMRGGQNSQSSRRVAMLF